MAESQVHMQLAQALVRWIANSYFEGSTGAILTDTGGTRSTSRSPNVGGYIPDVYASAAAIVIVGEAKTHKDLENPHCCHQLTAFLDFCAMNPKALFVVAVPWYRVAYVKNLLRDLCAESQLRAECWRVLENLPG